MRLAVSTLCDAAAVREGLLNILGGGITVFNRSSFPAPMSCSLAILVEVTVEDGAGPHHLNIEISRILADNLESIAEVNANFIQEEPAGPGSAAVTSVPLVLDMRDAGVPAPGEYQIQIRLNHVDVAQMMFEAHEVPELTENPSQST